MPQRILNDAHSAARAQFDKIREMMDKLQASRSEFDRLLGLGVLVEPDDVIKGAANLVGQGVDPHNIAGLLADMPAVGGEPLQAWLTEQNRQLSQMEMMAQPMREAARHQLAQAALHSLIGDHVLGGTGAMPQAGAPGPISPSAPGSNPLSARGPGSGPPQLSMTSPTQGSA